MTQRVEKAIEAIRRGEFVIVADDEARENEGDLVIAAEAMTAEKMAWMIRHTSGIICVPMLAERLDRLHLPQMVPDNTDRHRTAFTVSVDAACGTTTGVSASDRAITVQVLCEEGTRPQDLRRPGHVFPLRYAEGGVLKRAGHTEATVDLCQLAGAKPIGVLAELCNDDGTMIRRDGLERFAEKEGLVYITVGELVRYRRRTEKLVERVSTARIPTRFGEFTAHVYRSVLDDIEHLALVRGSVAGEKDVLVRVHSECLTGDILGSQRCDCRSQLELALEMMAEADQGTLVYLRGHEGRGIGLGHKMRAYHLQDLGRDTVEANTELGLPVDSREYGIGAQILADLGVTSMRLLTNNPAKYGGLEGYDLSITERVSLRPEPTEHNERYLRCKQEKLGHLLNLPEESPNA